MQTSLSSILKNITGMLFVFIVALQMIVILVGTSLYFYIKSGACTEKELHRIASPHKMVDAVVVQRHCGLDGGDDKLYFVPVNTSPSETSKLVAYPGEAYDIYVSWLSPDEFLMTYNHNVWRNHEAKNVRLQYKLIIEENN